MGKKIRFKEDRRLPSNELITNGTVRDDFSDEDTAAFVNNGVAEYVNAGTGIEDKGTKDEDNQADLKS